MFMEKIIAPALIISLTLALIGYTTTENSYGFPVSTIPMVLFALLLIPIIWKKRKLKRIRINKKAVYVALYLIILIGICIRVYAVHEIGQTVDSFFHVVNANDFAHKAELQYRRAELYTLSLVPSIVLNSNYYSFTTYASNILSSLATILLTFFIAKKYTSSVPALGAAALVSFSFWHVSETQNIRMYSMLIPIFLLTLHLGIESLIGTNLFKQKRLKVTHIVTLICWLLSFIISFHLHQISILILPTLFIGPLLLLLSKKRQRFSKNKIAIFYLSSTICGIALLVLKPEYFLHFTSAVNISYSFNEIGHIFTSNRSATGWIIQTFGLTTTAIIVWTIIDSVIKRKLKLLTVALVLLTIILSSTFLFGRYFAPRYISVAIPLMSILLSVGTFSIFTRIIKSQKLVIVLTIATLILLNPWNMLRESIEHKTGENAVYEIYYDFAGVIKELDINKKPVISTSFGIGSLSRSKNTLNINRLSSDGNGSEIAESKIINDFNTFVSNNNSGYIITDIYRLKKWNCNEAVPCKIRSQIFTDKRFRKIEHNGDPQIIVYKWEN